MQQIIFIADLIACWTCFWHHYAHHQELESIIQVAAACGIWCFGFQVVGKVWSWRLCVRFAGCNHLYNTLELLMMGIVLPETCWACNKYHLLHLVGILFPHNNDDAQSKSPQTDIYQSTHSYTGLAVHCYNYYIIAVFPFMSKSFLILVICSPAVSNWSCDLLTVLSHLSLIVSRLHKIWYCCICWADILLLFLLRIFIDN